MKEQIMHYFDEQVVTDLEFDVIRIMLHDYCIGDTARIRSTDISPMIQRSDVIESLSLVKEFHRIRTEGYTFPALDYQELHREIRILAVRDSVLSEESFRNLIDASRLVNSLVQFFKQNKETFVRLSALHAEVYHTTEIIDPIEKVFDLRGLVRDDASPELYRIRQEIQSVRRKINRNFNKELKEFIDKGWLADTKEGFVNERRVLAVMSTHKRKIPGMALGSSKTGTVTFIEPQVNTALNFEFEMLQDDERKEIYRILMALTREIRKSLPLIEAYQKLLPELDFINAKTKLALEINADMPAISDEQEIDLINAYHPILLLTNKKSGNKTHAQSLRMDKFSRMLVISGPNAGGKSITLKTVGLLQLMLQSGLLIPASPNSKMCLFHSILTDIGDNQSIENQLSTYSYRLKRMKHFLDVANRRSLLLLDEFGTGSDPDLGGALAEVFFEELYNRKSFGVVTTHYGNIKLKASHLRNAINGSMLFDKESLEPLYRLDIGQPGSSFTFEVAEINGIPQALIEDAKSRLDVNKVQMDNLIAELQKEKSELEKLVANARKAEQEALKAKESFESRQAKYEDKLQSQQELIERNNHFLIRGRKMQSFIDQFVTKGKGTQNKTLLEEVKKFITVEKTKIEDAKRAEELKIKSAAKKQPKKKQKPEQDLIKVGSLVKLVGGKQSGTVIELDGKNATVAFGVFKTKVEKAKLDFIK